MSGIKTTLGKITETAKELITDENVIILEKKVLLNLYYFYVMDCIKDNKQILLGSDWYEMKHKKKNV